MFTTDGKVLFCKTCNIPVNASKKFQMDQHLKTAKHLKNANLKTPKQTLFADCGPNNSVVPTKNQFYMDFCEALVTANIPLNKLNCEIFHSFLEKYTKTVVPSESTLRKNYIPSLYEATINKIRRNLENKDLWVSLDETTDVIGRYVHTSG